MCRAWADAWRNWEGSREFEARVWVGARAAAMVPRVGAHGVCPSIDAATPSHPAPFESQKVRCPRSRFKPTVVVADRSPSPFATELRRSAGTRRVPLRGQPTSPTDRTASSDPSPRRSQPHLAEPPTPTSGLSETCGFRWSAGRSHRRLWVWFGVRRIGFSYSRGPPLTPGYDLHLIRRGRHEWASERTEHADGHDRFDASRMPGGLPDDFGVSRRRRQLGQPTINQNRERAAAY